MAARGVHHPVNTGAVAAAVAPTLLTDIASPTVVGALATGPVGVVPVSFAAAPDFASSAVTPAYSSGLDLTYKGVNYVGDVYGSFTNADSLPSLASYNINAAALTADFGIDALNNTIYQNDVAGGYTESNADIQAAATQAESLGLKVMLRPLIDFLPANYDTDPGGTNALDGSYYADEWRSYYNPGAAGSAGAKAFFASYQSMIVAQAKVAQAAGVQLFCIGTELDQITGPAYQSYWDNIITAVRAVYSGKLTYAASWDDNQSPWQYGGTGLAAGTGSLTTQVSFWSKLDYIGVDNYAPISDAANPTLQDLINGWAQAPTDSLTSAVTGGESLIAYYEGLASALGKPLLFTETGYADSSDAASSPATPGYDEGGNPDGAVADPSLQANLYQAFFTAWNEYGNSALAGTFFWDWEPGGAGISAFSPQGLPAATQLADGYALCFLRGTRILTPGGEVAVEDLRAGDAVLTRFGGVQRVKWMGRQRYARRFLSPDRYPVCLKAGALGEGTPIRDLYVSPGHALLVAERLVLARALVNGVTVTQDAAPELVDYFHVELEGHDCLFAEGAWAESYADGPGLRAQFHNAAECGGCVPPEMVRTCVERPLAGPRLEMAVALVAARAARGMAPGRLMGFVDLVTPEGRVEGWARDEAQPLLPVCLELRVGGRAVDTALACHERGDVGRCAFVFETRRMLSGQVSVHRVGDGVALGGAVVRAA
jgi:hypothetical protein